MATEVSGRFVREAALKRVWAGPIIDLGAGGYSNYYEPHFKGTKYYKLDLEPQPQGGTDIIADIHKMPQVLSDSYGVVLLCEVLEHVRNPFLVVDEAARILRSGGLLIVTTVACWCLHRHPKDYWRFLPDGLDELCCRAGLIKYFERLEPEDITKPAHACIAAYKP